MTKIIVDEKKRVVTAIIRNAHHTVVGHAYCRKSDEFSYEKGRDLALARAKANMNRANINYYKKMMNAHLGQAESFRLMMVGAQAKQVVFDDVKNQVYDRLSGTHQSNRVEKKTDSAPVAHQVHVVQGDNVIDALLGTLTAIEDTRRLTRDVSEGVQKLARKTREGKNKKHWRCDENVGRVRSDVKGPNRGAHRHR